MYRVGVIGLGSIASRYSTPDDAYPYCHTGGIRFCETTELVAVADMSAERQEEFQQIWGPAFPDNSITYYETDTQMLESEDLDIVAVCVRGPHHFKVMQNVLKADIKAIFLEKPPGCSLEEVDTMTAGADAKGIPIVVDYTRHWGPHLIRLQSLIKDGLIGEVQTVIGYCGGGVLSFAIHTTDMICQFAGYDPVSVTGFVEGVEMCQRLMNLNQRLSVQRFDMKVALWASMSGIMGREVDFPLMCLVARVAFRQDFIAAQPSIKKGS